MNQLISFVLLCSTICGATAPACRAASPASSEPAPEIALFVITQPATKVRTFRLDPNGQADLALDDKPHGLRARLTVKDELCTLVYSAEDGANILCEKTVRLNLPFRMPAGVETAPWAEQIHRYRLARVPQPVGKP